MNISGIYQIQSKIKPKRIYIGSAKNIHKRWIGHLHHLRKNIHDSKKLQNHFNKYGEVDLQFSILLGCEQEDLIKIEQYFIDSYNPYFNICKIAGSCRGRTAWNKGISCPKSVRDKISKGLTGRERTEEHKNNLSKAGKNKSFTIERRINISNALSNYNKQKRTKRNSV